MDTEILSILKKVSEYYDLDGSVADYSRCDSGHINDTYKVKIVKDDGKYEYYIFQRINDYVFKEPDKVMHNIKIISMHLKSKKTKKCDCRIIEYLDNKNGSNYTQCEYGYWRVSPYVKNSVTFETVENPKILRSAGYAFGRFQWLLSDLPMDELYETIPNFHNTKKRLKDLFDIAALDPVGRAKEVEADIKFFEDNREIASKLIDMQESGLLPLRVTHNDTKYNNILMDKDTCKPLCVIDLDTVMPGLSAYDFGDAIRFAASTAVEDETDLSKVELDMEKFEEFTKGFISASKGFLTKNEIDTLALGAIVITIELASRFLADHINGDKYFRIHRPNHNLDRARCQIKLACDMISKYDQMCNIVKKYSRQMANYTKSTRSFRLSNVSNAL